MIESVHIQGFRSLADVEISDMPKAAVLIGANGSGKSNFIRFFDMLGWMLRSRRLGEFVERYGGADDQLFGGSSVTPRLTAKIGIRTHNTLNEYRFTLSHAHPDRFLFTDERLRLNVHAPLTAQWNRLGSGHSEAMIVEAAQSGSGIDSTIAAVTLNLLRTCSIHQFHDTSNTSNFKKRWDAGDSDRLRSHGGNLAAVLYRLENEDIRRYEAICRHIGRILPGFDRFDIRETYGKVALRWKAKGADKTYGAHLTSDGSLRFFALVTLLNLPPEMLPDVIMLDEPELGLHPAAVTLVGGMIKSLSQERQVVVATQSPLLVDVFDLEQIFVLDLQNGETKLRKLNPDDYRLWLEDSFTPGELWQKNLLGGRP